MGKNLKGRELGKGLSQRKDGRYSARYTDELGKRHEKYFATLQEAKIWMKELQNTPKPQSTSFVHSDLTVDAWFEFWTTHIVCDLAPNTLRNDRERYKHNIQPILGHMRLQNVKPMYCKMVFNRLEADYAGSTIRQTYIAMTPCGIHTPPVPSKVGCFPRCCKSSLVMPASKPPWIVMSM